MHFLRAAEALGKRKWLLLCSVIMAVGLTWFATRKAGSRWQATVQLVVPQGASLNNPGGGGKGSDVETNDPSSALAAAKNIALVYVTMLKGREVIEPTLLALNRPLSDRAFVPTIDLTATAPRMFQMQVTDTTAARATDLANTLADKFLAEYGRLNTKQAHDRVELLEHQLKEATDTLSATRHRYDAYRNQHAIVGSTATHFDQTLIRLKDARQKRDDAAAKEAEEKARLKRMESELSRLPATVPLRVSAADSPLVKQLEADLAQTEKDILTLQARYTDENPQLDAARKNRAALQARLKQEQEKPGEILGQQPNPEATRIQNDIATLKEQIAGSAAEAASLQKTLDSTQQELDRLKGIDSPLSALASEIAEQQEARSSLVTRLNAARMELDATEKQNPLAIMDRVSAYNPPVNITAGRSTRLLILAGVGAFLLTSGLILAMESGDKRLKTVKDAEQALPGRILAAIPQPMGAVTYDQLARATELQPQSLHAEAYRFLGMHLLNASDTPVRSLMALAAKAEQGSTSTLTNLGITLAQAGKKVVIVDANVRTAELHMVFDLKNDFGFTDLLKNPAPEAMKRAVRPTSVQNLSAITSGPIPANPWELLRSPNLLSIAEQLKETADFILWDTPSALMFTDALNLAPVVDAAFLCVRALEPLTGAEQRMIELMESAHVKVLGSVVNHVPSAIVEGYANYQHYYAPQVPATPAPQRPAIPQSQAGGAVASNPEA